MARRKVLTEERKDLIGRTCINCGTEEDIEYHHVVPLCNGGNDVIANLVPLCHSCHCLAHGGRDLTELKRSKGTLRGGRHAKCSDEEAFIALDMMADGVIGNTECKRRMKLSKKTFPIMTSQYKKWCDARGIKSMRTNYDSIATNSPTNMKPGYPVGTIYYNDGSKKQILFKNSQDNHTVYTYRDAIGVFEEPQELSDSLRTWKIEQFAKRFGVDEVRDNFEFRDLILELPFIEERRRLRNATTA